MKITTRKTNNGLTGPKIVARSGNAQKTVAYDLSKSSYYNHGAGAAALIQHIDKRDGLSHGLVAVRDIALGNVKHDTSEDGGTHTFIIA